MVLDELNLRVCSSESSDVIAVPRFLFLFLYFYFYFCDTIISNWF